MRSSGSLELLWGLLSQLNGLPSFWLGVTLIGVIAILSAVVDYVPIYLVEQTRAGGDAGVIRHCQHFISPVF